MASSSVIAPAAHAADTSPKLCPTTASGVRPHARSSPVSPTCTANSAGWSTSTSSRRDSASLAASSRAIVGGACRPSASSQAWIASAKTGSLA